MCKFAGRSILGKKMGTVVQSTDRTVFAAESTAMLCKLPRPAANAQTNRSGYFAWEINLSNNHVHIFLYSFLYPFQLRESTTSSSDS
jgi:hypothetical protein